MGTVSTLAAPVNGASAQSDREAVVAFIDNQKKRGDLGESAAIQRITALNQMWSMVAEDEPKDARSVVNNVEQLRDRWARKHPESKKVETFVKLQEESQAPRFYCVCSAAELAHFPHPIDEAGTCTNCSRTPRTS